MTQQCAVCGQSYGMTHACPGPAASPSAYAVPDQWATPKGFSPMFYLRQAVAIARFDDAAILAASRDPAALVYGGIFWLLTRTVIYVVPRFVLFRAYLKGYEINFAQIAIGICIVVVFDFLLMLAQYAISHGLARWWLGARGKYVGILRATWLGSIVLLAYPIPYVGSLIAGIWMTAILMCVFEEVDGIERMKAFALSYGPAILFYFLALELSRPRQ